MFQKLLKINIIVVAFFLLGALPAMASREKVNFRNKKNGTLKTQCVAIKDGDDAPATYRCYEDNHFHSFEPGVDWERVEVKKVCLHHLERDTISSCIKITGPDMAGQVFVCFRRKQPVLVHPSAGWREISSADKRCEPSIITDDLPRTFVFPSLSIEGGENVSRK